MPTNMMKPKDEDTNNLVAIQPIKMAESSLKSAQEEWNSSPNPSVKYQTGQSEIKQKEQKHPEKAPVAQEEWNSSPFPERPIPRWNAYGTERTNNRSQTMRRAIMDDPYTLFPKESVPELAAIAGESPENRKMTEMLAMKYASAQYFSNLYKIPFESAVDGFDTVAETFFGEKHSPQAVYQKLREIVKAEDMPGFWQRKGYDVLIGATNEAKRINDAGNALLVRPIAQLNNYLNYAVYKPLEVLSDKLGYKDVAGLFGRIADVRNKTVLHQISDNAEKKSRQLAENAEILTEWRGENANFSDDVASGVVQNLPALLLTLGCGGMKVAGQGAAGLYYGLGTTGSELEDTRYDNNMSVEGRILNALFCGMAEAIFENKFGFGKIYGKYFGKTAGKLTKEEIKRMSDGFLATSLRAAKNIGIDASGEGFEEVATGITQRFSNLLFHKDGRDLLTMNVDEIAAELLEPIPLEFSTGAVLGGLAGSFGFREQRRIYRNQAQYQNFKADMFGAAKEQLEELRSKESPTPEEAALAEKLETAVQSGNVDGHGGLVDLAFAELQRGMESRKNNPDDELSDAEYGEKLAREGLQEWRALESGDRTDSDEKRQNIRNAYDEIRQKFPAELDVELLDSVSLPDPLREKAETRRDIEGLYADGKIYLLEDRLELGRVGKVFLHEAAGHKGLRNLFGDKYESFLGQILTDHADEVSQTAARRGISLETREGMLEAADEYLAEFAETKLDITDPGNEKTSVWKRILTAFRAWLRKHGWNLVYTDAELTGLIRSSARGMRKNTIEKERTLLENNPDISDGTRFAIRDFDADKQSAESKKLRTFAEHYADSLRKFENGTLRSDEQFELGETPDALTMLGVEQLPVSMSGNLFFKAKEKHGLSIDELRQIPEALYNPVMIFDSSDRSSNPDGMVLLTQIHDVNEKPVVVALNLGKRQKNHIVNDIASIHGRGVEQIQGWINDGFLRYSHKKRALAFARFHRLQLPKKATISERHGNIIIDESPNVKPETEDIAGKVNTPDENNPDIRFSVNPKEDVRVAKLAKILYRYSGSMVMIDPEEAASILSKQNIRLDSVYDEKLLRAASVEAMLQKRERSKKLREAREDKAVAQKDEWTRLLIEQYGKNFKINPGPKYDEDVRKNPFTGTWMDVRKTEKGRSGSTQAEEIAKFLSGKAGKNISADMVVQHFGDLKRETLLDDYRAKRRKMRELHDIEELLEEEDRVASGIAPLSSEPRVESEYKRKLREKFQAEQAKAEQAELDQWLYENLEEWRWVMDSTGNFGLRHNFFLRPSYRFSGEDFSGNFIAPEFRRYSEYRPGRRTGKALADYQALREKMLKQAKGKHSDELAREIARKTGGEELEIEQRLVDFFRDLKRNDLRQMYRESKREEAERFRSEQQADHATAGADAAAEHYKNLLEMARNDRVNIIALQSSATAYARRYLPEEMQGHFLTGIANLSKWDSSPSPAYPDGRRRYEMEKLLSDMQTYRVRDRIRELLDGVKVRTKNGRPIQPLGEAKETVDKIRQIIAMPVYDVENKLSYLKEKREEALNHLDENKKPAPLQAEADRLTEEIALLDQFGKLELKSKEDCVSALETLRKLIENDRTGLLEKLQLKKYELGALRNIAMQEIQGRKIPVTGRVISEPPQPWKFTLMNNSLRGLIELVTSRSNKDMDDTVLGGLYRKLEKSTQKGVTFDREMSEQCIAKVRDTFGIRTIVQQSKFWREVEREEANTGIFVTRYQREITDYINPDTQEDATHVEERRGYGKTYITVENVRKLLAKSEAGEITFPDLTLEFLRQQLSDYDLGIERAYQIFQNEDEDAIFQTYVNAGKVPKDNQTPEILEKKTKLVLLKPPVKERAEQVELAISKAQAANLLMQWEQKDVQARMRWNGWTDQSIVQLKQYIGPDMIRFAYWMRDRIAETGKKVDTAAREIYGCGLPHIENYFPSSYQEHLGKQMKSDPLLGDSFGAMTVNPNFLIARRFHLSDVDLHRSIFYAYFKHQTEAGHFLAYGQSIRDCRSIINDRGVRESVCRTFGTNVYHALVDRIDLIANGGRTKCEAAEWMGKLFRYWVPAKIAVNTSSVLKQIAGSAAYMNEIPHTEFLKGISESFTGSEDFKRFYEFAKNSDYFKNRFAGGLNPEIQYLMKSAQSGRVEDALGNYLIDKGTWFTRWSDGISTLRAGYSVFRYHYRKAVENGKTHEEAWDHASEKWMRSTDETQQSGYMKDQNYFQSSQVYYKYLTAFLSNPIQIMNLELQTLNNIRYGSGSRKAEAIEKLQRQLIVNHVIIPTLMVAITEFMRHGFDLEDYSWENFLSAWLLGPFEGAFIAGKAFTALYGEVTGMFLNNRSFGDSTFNAFPLFDDGLNGIRKLRKLFTKESTLDTQDYLNAIQGLGDLVTLGGSAPVPLLGATGGMTSALMRELKRYYRLLFEQDHEKPLKL